MLRLFVTSNQISTVFCSTIAKNTHKQGDVDVLLIDNFIKKQSLVKLIYHSSAIHTWQHVLNLSTEIPDDFNLKPNLRKRILRRIKFLPVIETIYNFLLKIVVKKKNTKELEVIHQKINEVVGISPDTPVELFLLTQTSLNNFLTAYFNTAVVNYYEHGLVDYLYILEKNRVNNFYAVFGDSFQHFLRKKGAGVIFSIQTYFSREEGLKNFPAFKFEPDFLKKHAFNKLALILLDSSEIFSVQPRFWTDYLERCLQEIDKPADYLIIIKPHPNQSNEVLQLIKDYCKQKSKVLLIEDPSLISISVESMYISYMENINYVFSTYSAASFYLAKLFPEKRVFYFLYDFVGDYYRNGPRQYVVAYTELEPYMKNVFLTENCIFLN